MKLSNLIDCLAFAGLGLIGAGLYVLHPSFSSIYAGLILLVLAHFLTKREPSAPRADGEKES